MQKAFNNFLWKNFPSTDSPVNDVNLMKINNGLDTVDDRVITLDITKFDKVDAQSLIKSLTFNRANGVFTITYFNGATATIDTMLEKLAVNFDFDEDSQHLVIILDDGTEKRVDLSAFIKPIEFIDSDTIAWQLLDNGQVSAIVKEGSIQEKHLQPNYLADIKIEVAKAETSATAAAASEANAKASENAAKASEAAAKASETNSAMSASNAETSASTATTKATEAASSAASAADSATTATEKASEAATSAANAANSKTSAAASANMAEQKASEAATSAANAANSATECESAASMVNNAIDNINQGLPQFVINPDDGKLYHTPSRFTFFVNYITGNLDWGLTV